MSEKRDLTRADLVRQRREQENAKRMERAKKEATRPVSQATVARAKQQTVKKAEPAKRRFNIAIALPRPNLNLREVHIPRPQLDWRAFSFILAVLLGTALYLGFTRPEFRAAPAQVTGNQMLTPDEVNAVLNSTGQPIFTLIPSDMETRLRLNYPELASVRVTVALPNLVSVNLLERKPFARWEQGGGYTWIADDGVAFRPRGEIAELISVVAVSSPPVVGGAADPLTPTPFISEEMVRALKGLAGHVPPGSVILYDPAFGFGWNDPRGWRVYFGTGADDIELKMRVYESMVASLTQRGIRPALINVTYPSAPYYRMTP